MKTILQFLKDQIEPLCEGLGKIEIKDRDIEDLRNLFKRPSGSANKIRHFKIQPQIHRNQIWTVKTEYDDFQGICQKTSHPFIVLVNSEPEDIEGEEFVRVFLVSPFIEIACANDEVCHDSSIIGFPFLIETWNDQPMLTELLDQYLGYYEPKSISFQTAEAFELVNEPGTEYALSNVEELSENQQEFRNIDISRAKFINHSVLSLLSFLENRQSQDAGVVISISDKAEYPKFFIGQTHKEPTNALAAKSGVDTEDKYLLYENEILPFQIFFRKNEGGFIISVYTAYKMELFMNYNEEITGTSNKEKTVFANLQAGKYTLVSEQVKEPIKIRLK